MDISIIIVNWNAKEYLLSCLASIEETAGECTKEIIVVDNASGDGSAAALEADFPNVQVIRSEDNLGFAKANNLGISKSRGRYVCLVNPDVIVLAACIPALVEMMDRNPRVGLAGPRMLNPDGTLQPSCRRSPTLWSGICTALYLPRLFPRAAMFSDCLMRYWPHDTMRKVESLTGSFWIARREAIDDVGLLDEEFFLYGEDIDWCKRFWLGGWEVLFAPVGQAIHHGGASSANTPVACFVEKRKASVRVWGKYHGRVSTVAHVLILLFRDGVRLVLNVVWYVLCPAQRGVTRKKIVSHWACVRWLSCRRARAPRDSARTGPSQTGDGLVINERK